MFITFVTISCQQKVERLHTERTTSLVRELLTKLDSTDVYAARKEAYIEALKTQLGGAVLMKKNGGCYIWLLKNMLRL